MAEDLLQEVFVAAGLGADRFYRRAKVTTWLYRTAHNQAVTWLRRVRQVSGLDGLPELPAEDEPGTLAMETWRADQVRRASNNCRRSIERSWN